MSRAMLREMVEAKRSHRDHIAALAKERVRQWAAGFGSLWREVAHLDAQAELEGFGEVRVRHSEIAYVGGVETLSGKITATRGGVASWRNPEELIAEFAITDEGYVIELRFEGEGRPYPAFDKHTVKDALPTLRVRVADAFA